MQHVSLGLEMAVSWCHLLSSDDSLPEKTLRTIELAMASAFSGSFSSACCKAASASGNLPKCISATAWPIRLFAVDVDGVCAISSKT